jgi:hypothetical protein
MRVGRAEQSSEMIPTTTDTRYPHILLCHDKMKIRVNIRIATIPPKNAHI